MASERMPTADFVARAVALQPLLARNARTADVERRIPDENIAALAEAGLLSLGVPRRFGGGEAPIRTQLEVSAALGRACGSTAWVAQIINAAGVVTGMFSDRAQQDVWGAKPTVRVVGSMAPTKDVVRVDGGSSHPSNEPRVLDPPRCQRHEAERHVTRRSSLARQRKYQECPVGVVGAGEPRPAPADLPSAATHSSSTGFSSPITVRFPVCQQSREKSRRSTGRRRSTAPRLDRR
jgi:Acyl-CoA dehydrogenase, N-terminal domain